MLNNLIELVLVRDSTICFFFFTKTNVQTSYMTDQIFARWQQIILDEARLCTNKGQKETVGTTELDYNSISSSLNRQNLGRRRYCDIHLCFTILSILLSYITRSSCSACCTLCTTENDDLRDVTVAPELWYHFVNPYVVSF